MVDLMAIDSLEQRLARREMPIERADPDAGLARDRLQAGLRAAGAEDLASPPRAGSSRLRIESARSLRLVFALSGAHFISGSSTFAS